MSPEKQAGKECIQDHSKQGSARPVTSAQVAPPPPRWLRLHAGSKFLHLGDVVHQCRAPGAAALALLLANTDIFLSKPQRATLEYLEEIELKTLEKEPRMF